MTVSLTSHFVTCRFVVVSMFPTHLVSHVFWLLWWHGCFSQVYIHVQDCFRKVYIYIHNNLIIAKHLVCLVAKDNRYDTCTELCSLTSCVCEIIKFEFLSVIQIHLMLTGHSLETVSPASSYEATFSMCCFVVLVSYKYHRYTWYHICVCLILQQK